MTQHIERAFFMFHLFGNLCESLLAQHRVELISKDDESKNNPE